jgi:hypothetical protein
LRPFLPVGRVNFDNAPGFGIDPIAAPPAARKHESVYLAVRDNGEPKVTVGWNFRN